MAENTIFGLPVIVSDAMLPGEMILGDWSKFVTYIVRYTDERGIEHTETGTFELQPDNWYRFCKIE